MTSINAPTPTISIFPLSGETVDTWVDANIETRGEKEIRRLSSLWDAMRDDACRIWTAWHSVGDGTDFVGHIVLQYASLYAPFRQQGVPEIVDLWVQPAHRKKGAGRALLLAAENDARTRGASAVGLGVGVTASFGAAHRLYVSSGFMPDGSGLWYNGARVAEDETVTLDDAAVLMWVKTL